MMVAQGTPAAAAQLTRQPLLSALLCRQHPLDGALALPNCSLLLLCTTPAGLCRCGNSRHAHKHATCLPVR
jgi:hypothetical protein